MTMFLNLDKDGSLDRFSQKFEEAFEKEKEGFELSKLIYEFNEEEEEMDLDEQYEMWLDAYCPDWTPDVHPYWEGE